LKRRISKSQQADQRLLPLSFFGKGRNVGIFIIFATQKEKPVDFATGFQSLGRGLQN